MVISLLAAAVTVTNLAASIRSWQAYRTDGEAQRTVALGAVWSNGLLLLSTIGCLVIIIPALLREGDTPLNPFVVAAMLIPVGIAGASSIGRRARKRVERLLP